MCACKGNMYAVIKGILRAQGGPDVGGVRAPLYELQPEDLPAVEAMAKDITELAETYIEKGVELNPYWTRGGREAGS